MRSTLAEVLAALDNLEIYVHSIDPVNAALAGLADPMIRGYLNVRRQMDCAAFIVALYAAFEKFVEDLVWSHTEIESAAVPYQDLSDRLRHKHLQQSATLLAKGRLGEGRYANLTPVSVIANLHQCISGAGHYKLNRHAVVHHENNLRSAVVKEIFSLTGVADIHELARRAAPLVLWHSKVNGGAEPAPLASIERRLDQIVDLRNQVAHTGLGLEQLLGSDAMQDHLDFMRAYCRASYQVVATAYLDRTYVHKAGAATALGAFVAGPFRKQGGAVVVRKPECRAFVGQPVIGTRDKRVYGWGTIQEIQVDDKPVPAIEIADPETEVGLRVDFELTKGAELYLLPAKDDAVWS